LIVDHFSHEPMVLSMFNVEHSSSVYQEPIISCISPGTLLETQLPYSDVHLSHCFCKGSAPSWTHILPAKEAKWTTQECVCRSPPPHPHPQEQ